MKKNLVILVLILIIVPHFAYAQETANPCTIEGIKAAQDQGQDSDSTLPACINQIYRWSLGIGALLALLMIVIGGYYYMTSAGNAEQASKGTEMIWGAIIGLGLLFGAYLILSTINPDLVNFDFDTTELNQTPEDIRE